MAITIDAEQERARRPTVIYLPSEIEWLYEGNAWVLQTMSGKIHRVGGTHYTEEELKGAVASLAIEMLAQLESLAAYVDDIETQLGENEIASIHGDIKGSGIGSSSTAKPASRSQ